MIREPGGPLSALVARLPERCGTWTGCSSPCLGRSPSPLEVRVSMGAFTKMNRCNASERWLYFHAMQKWIHATPLHGEIGPIMLRAQSCVQEFPEVVYLVFIVKSQDQVGMSTSRLRWHYGQAMYWYCWRLCSFSGTETASYFVLFVIQSQRKKRFPEIKLSARHTHHKTASPSPDASD